MYKLTWKEWAGDGTTATRFDVDNDPIALMDWFEKTYKPKHPGLIASVPELTEVL